MEPLPQSEASPLGSVGATRKLMEHTARNILLTNPNMSLQCGSLVTGLRFSADNSTVSGTAAPCEVNRFHDQSRPTMMVAVWKSHSRGRAPLSVDLGAGVVLRMAARYQLTLSSMQVAATAESLNGWRQQAAQRRHSRSSTLVLDMALAPTKCPKTGALNMCVPSYLTSSLESRGVCL